MIWLRKIPIVSLLIASAMIAVPFILGNDRGSVLTVFEESRDEAREFWVRNPQLVVDPLGTLILDPDWLREARDAAAASDSSAAVELPPRMLARSQAKLDGIVELAYGARMELDPAWRLGVLDARTPVTNYFIHPFIHDHLVAVALCVAVLIFVGAPLERSWGSSIFALFSVVVTPLTAQAYRLLDAGSGVPWSGSAGLAGVLLGAYCIRGLGGHFMLPGWVLLPVWLAVEIIFVQELWVDGLGVVPWASLCAAVGIGALIAGAFRLLGVESKLDARVAKAARQGPNPVIARAARLRSDGDPHQAFDLIQAAWRDHPADHDIVEAFFSIAAEVGQAGAAAEAIRPSLYEALRSGDHARAIEYWIPISSTDTVMELEATAAVRLGEALLDAGHPEQAIQCLDGALDTGVSASQALRVVKVARDLDEDLARRAASVALSDSRLDLATRAELAPMVVKTDDCVANVAATDETETASESDADESAIAAQDSAQSMIADPNASSLAENPTFEDEADAVPDNSESTDSIEARLMEQYQDPNALSPESLLGDGAHDKPRGLGESHGDVLSHWDDSTRVEDSHHDVDPNLGSGLFSDDIDELECDESLTDLESADSRTHAWAGTDDPTGEETDTDLTPLIETSEELTNPLGSCSPADELTMMAEPTTSSVESVSTGDSSSVENQPTAVNPPVADPPALGMDSSLGATLVARRGLPAASHSEAQGEFAIGVEPNSDAKSEPDRRLRALRVVDAVPLAQHGDSLDIDTDHQGKSILPLERIEAIVVAGVNGLASRPVLLVDFPLNWAGDRTAPLKVIRFRSDRFDPRIFEPGEVNPLEALIAWVRRLQIRSQATCLPSRVILDGEFARYKTVEDYESEVLMAMREL